MSQCSFAMPMFGCSCFPVSTRSGQRTKGNLEELCAFLSETKDLLKDFSDILAQRPAALPQPEQATQVLQRFFRWAPGNAELKRFSKGELAVRQLRSCDQRVISTARRLHIYNLHSSIAEGLRNALACIMFTVSASIISSGSADMAEAAVSIQSLTTVGQHISKFITAIK